MLPDFFLQRQRTFQEQQKKYERQHNHLSIIRLLVFVLALIGAWWAYRTASTWLWIGVGLGIIFFLILLKKHRQVARQRDLYRHLAHLNQEEITRLKLQFSRTETGEEFAVKNHAYAHDLDIFGPHSLFKLLNRARTRVGMKTLAQWLLQPADEIEISVRQTSVAELIPLLDWRQNLEATALLEATVGQSTDFLENWIQMPDSAVVTRLRPWRWLPVFTIGLLMAAVLGWLPWGYGLLLVAFQAYLTARTLPLVKAYSEQSDQLLKTLKAYASLLQEIENQDFKSEKLKQLQRQLTTGQQRASVAVGQLSQLTENLNFRLNIYFFVAVGLPTLWDLQWITRIEDWKKAHRNHLTNWLETLGEIEALCSLAGFAYANPTAIFPNLSTEAMHLEARALAHPLIVPERRVANHLKTSGLGQTIVITGSNMSGKSTFLRTVGLNVVLALAGSVVCAEAFVCARVRVYTSMRTQDSLQENTSSFYAELKRLKMLLEMAQDNSLPVLYFLDEILKGTNSADRHKGAKALILQLHQQNASGFVSTHDLELGELAQQHDFVENYSFNSTFTEGKLHFDYQLNAGVCREFNAAELMRQIGIKMD
jgi:MutS domain V/MutS domain III